MTLGCCVSLCLYWIMQIHTAATTGIHNNQVSSSTLSQTLPLTNMHTLTKLVYYCLTVEIFTKYIHVWFPRHGFNNSQIIKGLRLKKIKKVG